MISEPLPGRVTVFTLIRVVSDYRLQLGGAMTDALAAPKNVVENLHRKLMGSFDVAELQAQQLGWAMLTDQCAATLVELYRAAMVELGELLIDRWRWIDRNSFVDRWYQYDHWKLYATQQLSQMHLECLTRLRSKLSAIKGQPEAYIPDTEIKLSEAWSKVQLDTTLKLHEVRAERMHAFWTSVGHGFKWFAATVGGALIALWIGHHFGKAS